jgi:predicted aspartyl protease
MDPVLLLIAPLAAMLATVPAVPILGAQQAAPQAPAEQLDFTTKETRMTVPVTIGSDGPYRFVVDTGSERTVISRELAGTLGLASGRMVRVTAMSGVANVGTVVIPDISVGSPTKGARLVGSRIEAPALIERNLGASGLVGIDTLQGHAVTIDFAKQIMTVVPSTKRLRTEHFGPDDIVVRAKSLSGQLVITDATYRGHTIRVVIDTGSMVSMGNLALRRIAGNFGMQQPVAVLGVTGTVMHADYAQIDGVRVGDIAFNQLPVAFADAAPFARLGLTQRPAMLLGMDALQLFGRVRIDFANRELRLARPTAGPQF